MLFHYTEPEKKTSEKNENAIHVRKCSIMRALFYIVFTLLFIAVGVLVLLLRPVPQYFTISLCLFVVSLVPILFFADFLCFRLSIGNGTVTLKRLMSPEVSYSYTEISWKMQNPSDKHSAVLLYCKGKQIARITQGTSNFASILSLRHKGTLSNEEKDLIRSYADHAQK